MKQAIIFSMIFLSTYAVGFSSDLTFKDTKSDSPENNLIVDNGGPKAYFQLNHDYRYHEIQGIDDKISGSQDNSGNNLELEKTDSPDNEESEDVRSHMIAGAMGIGIF